MWTANLRLKNVTIGKIQVTENDSYKVKDANTKKLERLKIKIQTYYSKGLDIKSNFRFQSDNIDN